MSGLRELTIDGVSMLSTYGLWISGNNVYNGAEPSVETVQVPGRNGDLIYFNDRYNNFQLKYPCLISQTFTMNMPSLRSFLYSNPYYRKIEDSYFDGMYRMGRIIGASNPTKISWADNVALVTLTFDCKPQHFYTLGDASRVINDAGTIRNTTRFIARPLIRIYLPTAAPATGQIIELIVTSQETETMGRFSRILIDRSIYNLDAGDRDYIDIDCDLQEAYHNGSSGILNMNKYISGSFPVFLPGISNFSLRNITKLDVTPKWWTL